MQASLAVPTATSFRVVPAKLLEVNRSVINGYLARTRGGKVSFTHLIGYAVVRAIADDVKVMNSTFVEGGDGKPRVVHHEHVSLGSGRRCREERRQPLLWSSRFSATPTRMSFAEFVAAYEDLIRKVRTNKLTVDDFQGATITLTNPGTIGTVQSVPRLMPGQGVIVGVGAIDFPAEYQAADERTLAELGVSKIVTITSTYDHRIIQGAESGLFLKRVHELLLGEDGFYDDAFSSLGVPYEAVRWRRDVNPVDREEARLHKQMQVATLIRVYRVRGHLIADLDPLAWKAPRMEPELDPATYGLTIWDFEREFLTGGLGGVEQLELGEILRILRDAYCRTIGIEYMHIQDTAEQRWIQEQVEGVRFTLSRDEQRHLLSRLNAAEAFEKFLATKYVGQKRFGLEGAESAIAILDAILSSAADEGLDGVVLGMPHRGRLNVLANIVGKSYDQIFKEFEGYVDPSSTQGSGDVKYHLGASGKFVSPAGADIAIELAANPSHLEAVDPVVVGMARARQDLIDRPGLVLRPADPDARRRRLRGAGRGRREPQHERHQGLPRRRHHPLVVNNQLGFTTAPEHARSSTYATDVAKMIQAPIFHVNGDDPEACVRVARLAFAFRQTFHKDVVIDMVCYRRHGHNEGDDPSYTQPLMYKLIDERRSVRKLYTEALVKRGELTLEEAEQSLDDFQHRLQAALDETRQSAPPAPPKAARPPAPIGVLPHVATGVDRAVARPRLPRAHRRCPTASRSIRSSPSSSRPAPRCTRTARSTGRRARRSPRLAPARGHRHPLDRSGHAAGHVQPPSRGARRLPHRVGLRAAGRARRGAGEVLGLRLAPVGVRRRRLRVRLLGRAQGRARRLGGAVRRLRERRAGHHRPVPRRRRGQVDPDLGSRLAVAARLRRPGTGALVGAHRALPHPVRRGQHPGRERTTPAQYFHLLRRQVRREIRKPLVLFTPKSLLRAKQARSPIDALATGSFDEVLDDPGVADAAAVRRIIFCSGKVAYDAMAHRDTLGAPVAVVRVEQLYPFPASSSSRSCGATRAHARSCGCRRSPRTWVRGGS